MRASTNSWWHRHQSAGIHQGVQKGWHSCECEHCLGCCRGSSRTMLRKMEELLSWNVHGHNNNVMNEACECKLKKSYVLQIRRMVDAHKIPSQLVIIWWSSRCQVSAIIKLDLRTRRSRDSWNCWSKRQMPSQSHTCRYTLRGVLYFHYKPCTMERLRGVILPNGFDIWHICWGPI